MRKKARGRKFSFSKALRNFFGFLSRFCRLSFPIVVLALVFLLAFQGIRKHLFADDFFNLSVVNVHTDGILTPADIIRIADLHVGENILGIHLREVTRRIESNRHIKEATVSRILPNQILIEVKERRDFLRVKLPSGDRLYVMDDEGYLLGPARSDSQLALFEDLRPNAKGSFGRERYQNGHLLRAVFTIKGLISNEPVLHAKKITRVKVESLEKISIFLEGDLEIRVGENYREDLEKLRVLRPILEKEIDYFQYIDLRFQNIVAKRKDKKRK